MNRVALNVEKSGFQKHILKKDFGKPKSQPPSHPLVLVLLFSRLILRSSSKNDPVIKYACMRIRINLNIPARSGTFRQPYICPSLQSVAVRQNPANRIVGCYPANPVRQLKAHSGRFLIVLLDCWAHKVSKNRINCNTFCCCTHHVIN